MPTSIAGRTLWLSLIAIGLIVSSLPVLGQSITGAVYRDFNSDGIYTSIPASGTYAYGEPGVGNVTVTAYNAAGTAVATTTSSTLTASLGSFTLTVNNSSAYRVEFTNLSTGDYESFRGTGSATSVQFVSGGATNVNLGINYPTDYCQTNPNFYVPCYVNGNPLGAGTSATQGVLVTLPYNSTGDSPAESAIATNAQIGTVYGVAYHRTAKTIFTGAFVKRHSGLGTGGAGAIYLTSPGSGTTYTSTLFATLPTAVSAVSSTAIGGITTVASNTDRGLPATTTDLNHDPITFDQVGKAGLGDVELSEDGTQLYAVNLGDRKLYQIPIINPNTTTPTAGIAVSFSLPTSVTQTTGSVLRPFALKVYHGKVYVGAVTTNEAVSTTINSGTGSTGSTALITRDPSTMQAIVFEFNPVNSSFTTVLSFPLSYTKGASDNDQTGVSRADRWFAWTNVQAATGALPNRYARNGVSNNSMNASYPQPILAGIEFDVDGSMILSIRDRFGDQYGNENVGTDPSNNTLLFRAIAPGDILRAGKCNPTVNQWTIENNAQVCGGTATLGANTNQGPGGGEYYYSDGVAIPSIANPYHAEMSEGGLALLPGRDEVAAVVLDPTTNIDAGGIRRFKNSNGSGSPTTSVQIYESTNVATYGKANGLGDLEISCDLPPIQIGNRVWQDSNNNGIQDPGETPLAGVSVNLKGTGLPAGGVSVVTNAQGEYYFSSATSGTATTSYANSLTGLTSGSSYTLTFPTSVTTNNSVLSSKPNSATGTNADQIDTDPTAAGLVIFTLGQFGQNNFSYDAGFVPCTPPSLTAVASSTSLCLGTPLTLTAQVSPADSYTYAWSAPANVTLTGATTATATATGFPTGTTTFTLTVSTSPSCSTFTTVSVVVNPSPTATLSSATICAGQSTTLTATGGTSYTFSNGVSNATGLLVVSPVSTTAYSVTVANASGCTSTTTGTVTVTALPTAALEALSPASATICAGQSTTLTASGGTSYRFSTTGITSTTATMVVSPTATTAYSVTVTNAGGCSSTTTSAVVVNPPPTATLTSATICAGQSVTLTATGGASYTFSNGTSNSTGLLIVSPSSTTAYSVTVATASGCASTTTASVTVNTLPTATLAALSPASATICAGQSTTLTASGGTTYRFSTTGITSATATMVASPTATTAYSVTVTNAGGCSSTATNTVVVNPLPTATLNPATICAGQSVTLTATGGSSYTFSNGVSNSTGALIVTPISTTAFSVTVANASGCTSTTTATVTVNLLPTASMTPPSATICAGQSVTLTATGGTSYTFSNGTSNNTGVLVMSPVSTTAYSVTVANASGCKSATTVSVTVNPLPTIITSVACNGIATFTVSFTATSGASVTANVGTVSGNQVTGIPSGQTVTLVTTLNGCTISTNITQNCQSNAAGLGDYVFVDTNKDGIQNTGDKPLQGVTAILYISGLSSATTTTDATGFYSFTGLTPGSSLSYSVGFTAPAGYTATLTNQGLNDAEDSDADVVTGRTQSITLTDGEFNPTLDAGFYLLTPTLSLEKFVDKSKAKLGATLSYTIVLTNSGIIPATNVVVKDSSTTGLVYLSSSAPAGTTFVSGSPLSLWTVANLSPGQSLSLTFQARADSSGILYNKATIPGDTASVCTSIPFVMCAGDDYAFTLAVPKGRSSYKWFKDNVEIIGQTTNILEVTAPGTYSLAVDNVTGKCPDFSCCPFIVEEDTLPKFQALAVPTTCVGTTPQANGKIVLSKFNAAYTYQYSLGSSFNAAATLSGSAKAIPADGLIVSNLANPVVAQAYTIRVFNASGCYTDLTVMLLPTVCGCPVEVCVPYVITQSKRPLRIGDPR